MAGKGSKPRPVDPKKYGPNFDSIPNFGFKPKWLRPRGERTNVVMLDVANWHNVAEGFRQFDPDKKKLAKLLDKKRNKG